MGAQSSKKITSLDLHFKTCTKIFLKKGFSESPCEVFISRGVGGKSNMQQAFLKLFPNILKILQAIYINVK